MGNLCLKKDEQKKQENQLNKPPLVEVNDEDMVMAKIKVQRDKLNARLKNLEEKEEKFDLEIRSHVANKNKEKALFGIKQKKMVRKYRKQAEMKLNVLEKQISSIEDAQDDIQFTQTLKESNQTLKKLQDQIDLEEIEIAKELDRDGKIVKEELENMLKDEEDEDLMQEINQIEADMVSEGMKDAPKDENEEIKENKEENQPEKQEEERKAEVMLN